MKRLFLGILAICWVIGVKAQEVFSPDGKINVRFFLSEKVSLIICRISVFNVFNESWDLF